MVYHHGCVHLRGSVSFALYCSALVALLLLPQATCGVINTHTHTGTHTHLYSITACMLIELGFGWSHDMRDNASSNAAGIVWRPTKKQRWSMRKASESIHISEQTFINSWVFVFSIFFLLFWRTPRYCCLNSFGLFHFLSYASWFHAGMLAQNHKLET